MSSEHGAVVIEVNKLCKTFRLPHEKRTSIKSILINFRKRRTYEKQEVLKDVSFDVRKGEFFGIVGRNGSGKSTLLKLLADIYTPTKGSTKVHGTLTPFIELGVGFNMELTGRENVFLNGALLGFSRKEMSVMYKDIVDFAELERFMDQKLKNYSSGMQVRLAFSIAIRARSDILLLDEVLAVGDAIFQKKCLDYFKQLKKNKNTVVFISHDANALQEYCDRGILIEHGKIISEGKIDRVVRDYIDLINKDEEHKSNQAVVNTENRWGTGSIKVLNTNTLSPKTQKTQNVYTEDDPIIRVRVIYKSEIAEKSPVYGITITDGGGQRVFQSNTLWSKIRTSPVSRGQKVVVEWDIPNVFNTGNLRVSSAVADHQGSTIYDWLEDARIFKIRKTLQSSATVNLGHNIVIKNLL